MEIKWIFLVIIILLLPSVLSECNSNQININTASKSELDEIYQIGESRAKEIINLRENKSFESVDDLRRVDGIGDKYLEDIKQEGIACVSSSKENNPPGEEKSTENNTKEIENESEDNDYETIKITNNEDSDSKNSDRADNKKNNDKPEIIKLSHANSKNGEENDKKSQDPKVIKKTNSFNFQKNKSKYANYGLVAVTLIVICSMLIKYRKNKYQNEFRE